MSLQDELKPVAPEGYLRIDVSNKAKDRQQSKTAQWIFEAHILSFILKR